MLDKRGMFLHSLFPLREENTPLNRSKSVDFSFYKT